MIPIAMHRSEESRHMGQYRVVASRRTTSGRTAFSAPLLSMGTLPSFMGDHHMTRMVSSQAQLF